MHDSKYIPNEKTLQAMRDTKMGINMEKTTIKEMLDEHQWNDKKYKAKVIKMLKEKGIEI